MPLHRNQGNMLTFDVDTRFLLQMRYPLPPTNARCVCRKLVYWSWRKVAGGVGAFADDGVGKWAAVAVAPTHWNVPMFVFSDATD